MRHVTDTTGECGAPGSGNHIRPGALPIIRAWGLDGGPAMSARIAAAFLMLGVLVGVGLLSTLRADNPAEAGTLYSTYADR